MAWPSPAQSGNEQNQTRNGFNERTYRMDQDSGGNLLCYHYDLHVILIHVTPIHVMFK